MDYDYLIKNYVSKNAYDDFYKKYNSMFLNLDKIQDFISPDLFSTLKKISTLSYRDFRAANEKILTKELSQYQDYFDTMFSKYGENIQLDEEQRRAILADDDYSLIVAGAGSGKTTTMAAKVKYLVDIKHVAPNEIVVLSYTRKAVNELKNRIVQTFGIETNIATFHSLALRFINQLIPSVYNIYDEKRQKEIILDYIKNVLFPDKEKLQAVIRIFPDLFFKGFVENYEKFKTFEEYFEDYKKRKYEKEKNSLHSYISTRMENLLALEDPMGLDLVSYKSKTEAKIANFLYLNSINYTYERPYYEKIGDHRIYRPDFTCTQHGKEVYIEYFGITKYQDMGLFTEKEIQTYNDNKKQKIAGFKERNDHYIALERNGRSDELLFLELRDKLKREGFELEKRTDIEVFEHLINENQEAEFFLFTKKILSLIGSIKETAFITPQFLKDFHHFLIQNFPNLEERNNKILESQIILEAYQYYNQELAKRNAIDFSDMISKAYYQLKTNPEQTDFSFRYLLVDEYQDISKKRFLLIKEIAEKFHAKIIAVGDDWQTIYTFAGSNIDLFYNFGRYFPDTGSHKITRTYRNSQELIDTAGEFVLKNKKQIPKSLVSIKHFENPIEIVLYHVMKELNALCLLLDELAEEFVGKKIAILTRTNKTRRAVLRDERFQEGPNDTIYYLKHKDLNIELVTMHRAKGTTFDEVILIDLKSEVFPSKGYSKSAITDFIEQRNIHEYYPFAEERRLFYVALTRTKNRVYLLTPYKRDNRCIFVSEIESRENVITKEIIEVI